MNNELKTWFRTLGKSDDLLTVGQFADYLEETGQSFGQAVRWAYRTGAIPFEDWAYSRKEMEEFRAGQRPLPRRYKVWSWFKHYGMSEDVFYAFQPRNRPKKHRYAMGSKHKTKRAAWVAFYHSWMKARVKDEEPVQLFGR